ncbi:MAG: hypothetical protein H6587_09660 [Flavobacteriales bacterium]|nr:hypothetical protein [Flavobacteriales bacterium]
MELQSDKGKTVAILSYITIIGFIIALVMNNDKQNKSDLGVFHLRQALGIYLTGVVLSIAQGIFLFIPFLGWIINLAITLSLIALFVFWILGLIAAVNSEKKAVPFVGKFYQDLFGSIG